MAYIYETLTNIGNRELNEDYAGAKASKGKLLAVVADGLGGHDKGEVASRLVTETILEEYNFDTEDLQEELHQAMQKAQEVLLARQKEEQLTDAMKTTCVAFVADDSEAYLGHVGDSRGYIFYTDKTWQRTCDHSVVQMLVLAGDAKEKQIRHHVDRNKLLRVFGTEWFKDFCEFLPTVEVAKAKAFLLCTDGFWELITERQMQKCLKKAASPKEWLEKMAAIVQKNGKNSNMDNYTAIAVFVD